MWLASRASLAVPSQVFKVLCIIFSTTTTCGNVELCYVMLTNKMQFEIDVSIQFSLSSTCFEHLMLIIRKTVLYMQLYMLRYSELKH